MIALFADAEGYQEFTRLVREFLPDREPEVLGQDIPEGMAAFIQAFRERYFPLDLVEDGNWESLEDLTRFIPIYPQGLSEDDYHDLPNWRLGVVLAPLLVGFEEGEGVRITLLEEALAGTPYQGLLAHARYLCHDTSSLFLDLTREEVWANPFEWDRVTVDMLTEHWRHAQAIEEEGNTFFDWLEEEDLEAHLTEVLDFLERRWRGKRQRRG